MQKTSNDWSWRFFAHNFTISGLSLKYENSMLRNLAEMSYIYTHILTYTNIYLHIHTYTYIYTHILTYTNIYLHIHTYTYIYTHILTYTHIY